MRTIPNQQEKNVQWFVVQRGTMIIVNDKEMVWEKGMTISDMFEHIDDAHLYTVIRLNGKLVSRINFKKTTISDDSVIYILPLIAGG